ncbi:Rossmann-fold NAD(P)-binding domain-containing protein [Actinophytocola algeriensis]|uniref:Short subunit dehydrogenase n=1 Tax=Actinophytocola algeriensis TaxID=1768010 RepID=A0A7W7VDA0_9PSEU|nr:hypothetical protein [Actinophytocola algeriensis]MBB4905983.1 hypothetical protein [Actinophytocola algeriensis]MBE1472332.1 hypothetical protein [Actinophytocola algeriensis]
MHAYGASKLENILFTTELHRRYHASGLSAASFYPGNVATNLASDTTSPVMRLVRFLASNALFRRVMLSTPDHGADQIVWLAEGVPGTDWQSGANYYKRRAVAPRNTQALDAGLARALWERSEELLAGRLSGFGMTNPVGPPSGRERHRTRALASRTRADFTRTADRLRDAGTCRSR